MSEAPWIGSAYQGLRVLDLSSNLAGPFAAMTLADMGADVTKVEAPGRGDDTRHLPPDWHGQGTVFLSVNRNKRSLAVDLRSEQGRDALLRLSERADVLIESFGPGVAERLGLDYAPVRERNPAIVYCTVSAFGSGPIGRELPGYDSLIQGLSGMMSITGHPAGPPARVAPSAIDLSTGLWVVIAISAALRQRALDGQGRWLELALIDVAFTLMGHQVLGLQASGVTPSRLGTAAPSAVPNSAFQASDGWVVVATANDRQFAALCEALELPALAADARFGTARSRVSERASLQPTLEARFRERTVEEWLTRLQAARVPANRLLDLAEALEHPLTRERGLLVKPASGSARGEPRQLRLPIDPDGSGVRKAPPALGEHTADVLREAGLDEELIEALVLAARC